jgi:peptide/nickel transport system permease protein
MRIVAQRAVRLVLTMFTVTFLCFAAMNVIGEPLVNILGAAALDPVNHADDIAAAKEKYHLDEPFLVRYGLWVGDLAQGDLGRSFVNDESVSKIVGEKLPVTLWLVLITQLLAISVAVPWALFAASKPEGPRSSTSTVSSFAMVSLPEFAVGVVLFHLLVVRWQILPSRYDDLTLGSRFHSLLAPSITLAIPLAATYQRVLHSELVMVLRSPYIAFARATGVPPRNVMWKHAFRPASFGLITTIGVTTGALIGGSLVIEQIFSIPGAGSEIVSAIVRDDMPTVLAFVVVLSIGFVVLNGIVDLAYILLDPRLRRR